MRSIEQHVHQLSDSEVTALINKHATELPGIDASTWDAGQIRAAFEWMHCLNLRKQHSLANVVFADLKTAVEAWHSAHPQDPEAIEFLCEWGIPAIRMSPESREDFVCLPLYQQLFDAVLDGPAAQHFRAVELKLLLMKHFSYWLERGGKTEMLEEADLQVLEDAQAGFEAMYEEIVDAAEERADYDSAVKLYGTAAEYYFLVEQPNDAIGCMKAVLEDLPNTTDYVPAARGEQLLELGKVFMQFKKFSVALKYFGEAKEVFEGEGDAFELQAMQAESWIENAEKLMKG